MQSLQQKVSLCTKWFHRILSEFIVVVNMDKWRSSECIGLMNGD